MNGYKPVFGTIERESESGGSGAIVAEEVAITNGGLSAPLSRQTSRKSPRTSPTKPTSQLPNPDAQVFESSLRFGSGPYSSRPMTGSATAPIPQYPFSQNRPPRGRDARLAMVHPRGRGGYRNASVPAKGFTSQTPPQTSGEGQAYPRGQMASTYMPAYGQQGYDPVQAGYMQMQMIGRGPPPPPMPQTSVPSLDPLRFYVLGQVSTFTPVVTCAEQEGGVLLFDAKPRHGLFPSSANGHGRLDRYPHGGLFQPCQIPHS